MQPNYPSHGVTCFAGNWMFAGKRILEPKVIVRNPVTTSTDPEEAAEGRNYAGGIAVEDTKFTTQLFFPEWLTTPTLIWIFWAFTV